MTSNNTPTLQYERISQDREGRELGVGRQREDNDLLCARNGWNVVARYRDNDRGASTRSTKARPRYDRMIADIQTKAYGPWPYRIVAYSTGRLTRRPMENELLIQMAESGKIQIHTVKSTDVDLTTAAGRMVARVLAAQDAMEAEQAGERIERAAQQRREQGRGHGGVRSFGYRYAGSGKLEVVDEEADAIREGARMILNGRRLMEVGTEWDRRGLLTPRGKKWELPDSIKKALTNARVAGWTTHEDERVAEGDWEPILDRDTWEAVRAILDEPQRKRPQIAGRKHLLSGYLVCGLCEMPLKINATRYICRKGQSNGRACGKVTRQEQWLEDAVRGWVFTCLANGYVPQGEAGPAEDVGAEIDAVEREIKKLMDAYQADVFTLDEVTPRVSPLRLRLAELRETESRSIKAHATRSGEEGVKQVELWMTTTLDTLGTRREILGRYVKQVRVLPVGKGNQVTAGSIEIVETGGRVRQPTRPDWTGDPFLAWSATQP